MAETECYTYDAAGRLTLTENSEEGDTRFRYDSNGNLLSYGDPDEQNTVTLTYNAGTNQLQKTSDALVPYTYNSKGSVMQIDTGPGGSPVNRFVRDYQTERIRTITNDNCRVDYNYDPLGRRIDRKSQDVGSNTCNSD